MLVANISYLPISYAGVNENVTGMVSYHFIMNLFHWVLSIIMCIVGNPGDLQNFLNDLCSSLRNTQATQTSLEYPEGNTCYWLNHFLIVEWLV